MTILKFEVNVAAYVYRSQIVQNSNHVYIYMCANSKMEHTGDAIKASSCLIPSNNLGKNDVHVYYRVHLYTVYWSYKFHLHFTFLYTYMYTCMHIPTCIYLYIKYYWIDMLYIILINHYCLKESTDHTVLVYLLMFLLQKYM